LSSSSNDLCRESKIYAKLGRAQSSSLDLGIHRSRLAGLGLEYADFREYQPDDDVRYVDWRLSARSVDIYGEMKLFTKVFFSERRCEEVVVLDLSESMASYGKLLTAIYAVSMILELAHRLGDTVTLVLLGDRARIFPRMSPREAIGRIIDTVCRGSLPKRSYLHHLAELLKKMKRSKPVMVFTDYGHEVEELVELLTVARTRFVPLAMVLAIHRWEVEPPMDRGFVALMDLEQGFEILDDVVEIYEAIAKHVSMFRAYMESFGVPYLELRGLEHVRSTWFRLLDLFVRIRQGTPSPRI